MQSCIILPSIVLAVKGADIDIFTSDVFGYRSLTQYGYVYQPETNCRAHFTFQVKACSDVHVGLFQIEGNLTSAYEIVLGGWYNTQSRVLNKDRPQDFVGYYENDLVDCNAYNSFWISWRNNEVLIGIGDVFDHVIVSFTDETPNQVGYIGISTGYGVTGDWKIPNESSDIDVSTSDVKGYVLLTQYGYVYQPELDCFALFTFRVKACHNVHVGLFNGNSGAPFSFEFVLGGWSNSRSKLRVGSSFYVDNFESDVLDCNAYRSFWVAWRNNVVAAGRGDLLNNGMLLSFTDQTPNQVRYIGISTGYGATGEWKIPNKQPPLQCYQQARWILSPGLQNTNMTYNITWSVTADALGQCAVTCRRSSSCVSFVYNNDKHTCQGHGQKSNDVAEGQGHTHSGSHYYIKP